MGLSLMTAKRKKREGSQLPTAWKAVGDAFKNWRKSETRELSSSPLASVSAIFPESD